MGLTSVCLWGRVGETGAGEDDAHLRNGIQLQGGRQLAADEVPALDGVRHLLLHPAVDGDQALLDAGLQLGAAHLWQLPAQEGIQPHLVLQAGTALTVGHFGRIM